LHGGGNSSVKTRVADLNNEAVDVLCVKGSGWDMGLIEPAGGPSVGTQDTADVTTVDGGNIAAALR